MVCQLNLVDKMKVTFGIELDGYESLCPSNTVGEVTVGPLGLLNILETQLGLTGNWPSEALRVVQYLHCLRSINNGARFYSQSLVNDEIAVARSLLSWRDTWIEAGWNGSASLGDSLRLRDLAEVERCTKDVLSLGTPDRLQNLLTELRKRGGLQITVYLTDDISNLTSVWQEILSLLNMVQPDAETIKGVIAAEGSDLALLQNIVTNSQKVRFQGDGSVMFLTAHSEEVLARCLAQIIDQGDNSIKGSWFSERLNTSILTGKNDDILDMIFPGHDLPRLGSSSPSRWRPHLQVLPLSISLIWEPLEPYRLLEFLVNPVCPLPAFARYRLAEVVARYPGIEGEEWIRKVGDLQDKFSKEKDLSALIEQWLKPGRYDPEVGVPATLAAERCQQVSRWAAAQASRRDLKPGVKELFYAASSQSSTAAKLLDEMSKGGVQTIKRLQLDRLLDQATSRGVSISENFAECGHAHKVNSPAAIIESNERIIWWDFVEPYMPSKWPWSPQEIVQMQAHGIRLPTVDYLLQQQAKSWIRPILSATRQIIFMIPRAKGNDALRRHPIWDLIESKAENTLPLIDIDNSLSTKASSSALALNLDNLPRKELPAPVRWWTIDEKGQLLTSRDKESFSSLDAFINSPYQWVLRYKAKLEPGSLAQVEDDNRQKGNLLHHLIELLLGTDGVGWREASEVELKTWVDKTFADLLHKDEYKCLAEKLAIDAIHVNLTDNAAFKERFAKSLEFPSR